jgi:hypothetical protein
MAVKLLPLWLVALISFAWAQEATIPHVFVDGQPSQANEVNENFESLHERLLALERALDQGPPVITATPLVLNEQTGLFESEITIEDDLELNSFRLAAKRYMFVEANSFAELFEPAGFIDLSGDGLVREGFFSPNTKAITFKSYWWPYAGSVAPAAPIAFSDTVLAQDSSGKWGRLTIEIEQFPTLSPLKAGLYKFDTPFSQKLGELDECWDRRFLAFGGEPEEELIVGLAILPPRYNYGTEAWLGFEIPRTLFVNDNGDYYSNWNVDSFLGASFQGGLSPRQSYWDLGDGFGANILGGDPGEEITDSTGPVSITITSETTFTYRGESNCVIGGVEKPKITFETNAVLVTPCSELDYCKAFY